MSGSDGSPYQQLDQPQGGPAPGFYADQVSSVAGGQVTAPAGGAVIATIAAGSLPVGAYRILVETMVVGTPAAVDLNNFRVRRAATSIATPVAAAGGAVGTVPCTPTISDLGRVLFDGASALSVVASGAGTAGAIYCASIRAIPVA